jgi:hypothetical protein
MLVRFHEILIWQIFQKYSNIKIPSNCVQWEPSFSMQTDSHQDGQRDMTTLTVAFHNFANTPTNKMTEQAFKRPPARSSSNKGSLNNTKQRLWKKVTNLGLFRPSSNECVAHGENGPQVGKFAGNIPNNQSRTTTNQWRTQDFFGKGGGSTNSVEDRGQRERGSGGGSPLVRGSTQFANERNPYSD